MPINVPDSLPLLCSTNVFVLRLSPVENLEELGDTVPHARVHVSLGAFDVVVKVISEQLDVGRRESGGLGSEVSREEYWID